MMRLEALAELETAEVNTQMRAGGAKATARGVSSSAAVGFRRRSTEGRRWSNGRGGRQLR